MKKIRKTQTGISPEFVISQLQQTEINKISKTQLQNVYSTAIGTECPVQVIPQFLIKMCEYELNPSILLAQLLYWNDKGNNKSHWIYKTKKEWHEETGLTERKLENAIDFLGIRNSEKDNGKRKGWIEVDNLPARGGRYTGHFKITKKFIDDFVTFCNTLQNADTQQNAAKPPTKCKVYTQQNAAYKPNKMQPNTPQTANLNNIDYNKDYYIGDSQRIKKEEEPVFNKLGTSPFVDTMCPEEQDKNKEHTFLLKKLLSEN